MKLTPNPGKQKEYSPKASTDKSFPIVAIGASAGGLEAISVLLKNLPSNTGMAFIYVQHLSPNHKSMLSSILSKITKMKVQEIENMAHMLPNNVYVIPPNKGIEVTDGHIKLLPHSKGSSPISIDVLFSSLAKTHKANVIGVILSGYASDGKIGLKAIKEAGGITFAQDDSAQASSMPKSAIASGAVDFILSPKGIALELAKISKKGVLRKIIKGKQEKLINTNLNSDLNTLFEILFKKTGVDFSHYKMPTIRRRLNLKMAQVGAKTIKGYIKLLIKNSDNVERLYKDLLINVTGFFRDKDVFNYLKTSFFPKILKNKTVDESIRIWVPACSTGEEVYSIAMLIAELQDNKTKKIPVQIFGTDLSEEVIRYARIGEYSQSDVKSIPKKYLDRFFTKTGNNYQIVKKLREMCVFAPHNILRDPPFSRMDFISCRNLLIYFDPAAQKKVFSALHFSLNEKGYLMLGKAESVGTSSTLFTSVNNKFKIYCGKKNAGARKILELPLFYPKTNTHNKAAVVSSKNITANPKDMENAIDSVLLTNYMPACAVVNKDMEILQFRGPISLYLTHPSGKASLNILKMTQPEFAFELRNAINKAIKTKQLVSKSGIEIKINSVLQMISIEVSPLKIEWEEPLLLIVFKLQEQVEQIIGNGKKVSAGNGIAQRDRRIKKLTEELNNTRAEMNSIVESHEKMYEELQAANEEIVSSNEEFQTLNEELETSKEETEATNEELISYNQEIHMRNSQLTESQEFSEAIINTIHEPMLVLYKDFSIKSANKTFYEKFIVKKEDTEGKFLFDLGNKQWNIPKLRKMLNDVLSKNKNFEKFEVIQKFPGLGEKTMLLNARLILQNIKSEKLVLLAIADVSEERRLANIVKLKESKILQNEEKGKWAAELLIANKKLVFQNKEKEKRAAELVIANKELVFQTSEKEKRAAELVIAGIELNFQNKEKEKREIAVNEQKRISTELTEAKIFAELATEIAEEAKEKAEKATRIAEDAVQSKQQFLSNMSHEIRTPMNAIIGFTKVLLKTDLTSKQKEYLSAIKISGEALTVLINDILDLAKVDSGKMIFEQTPFKMKVSISAMLHLFETTIREKNLEFVKIYDDKIPEVLVGDPVRLHQIILNLVSNAVKFTTKGRITVSVNLLKEDEKNVTLEFSIKDTGIGIPEDKIASIFEVFQQASSETSRLYGGTGLGLAIVKQLIEPQGGSIRVESKINEGSAFNFILSFQKTNAKADLEIATVELDPEIKNIKVLVVEDIALNQLLMKTLLDDFGFERDFADNGKIAIERLQTKSYDIILMDLQMPEMNGFEATEYIRNTLNSKIPIIALTADVTTVDVEKCKAVGMNDYIAKPVDERLLYSKIVGLVKKPVSVKNSGRTNHQHIEPKKLKYVDLNYLNERTKSNPAMMKEMISVYLEQTPTLISAMKKSLIDKDWDLLNKIVHKMIPSFSIMGIDADHENIILKIQECTETKKHLDKIPNLVLQLSTVCSFACDELQQELNRIKNTP